MALTLPHRVLRRGAGHTPRDGRLLIRRLLSRRGFLTSTVGVALAGLFPVCSTEGSRRELQRRTLLRMARLLYPHDVLDDDVYMDALLPVLARAESNKGFAAFLRKGIAMLDGEERGSWLAASRDEQLRVLERVENESFFRVIRSNVRGKLYEHRTVWNLIGYEGSSAEYGGYLHRGFDDIDWLPQSRS